MKDLGTSSRKSIEEVEWPNFSKAEMWEEDALTPHSPVKIDRSESLLRAADLQGSYSKALQAVITWQRRQGFAAMLRAVEWSGIEMPPA